MYLLQENTISFKKTIERTNKFNYNQNLKITIL